MNFIDHLEQGAKGKNATTHFHTCWHKRALVHYFTVKNFLFKPSKSTFEKVFSNVWNIDLFHSWSLNLSNEFYHNLKQYKYSILNNQKGSIASDKVRKSYFVFWYHDIKPQSYIIIHFITFLLHFVLNLKWKIYKR